jgi:hypothetical protein
MRKLTLQPEALNVDSFVTDEIARGTGTVFGQDDTRVTEFCTMFKTCVPTHDANCATYNCQLHEEAPNADVRVPE